MQMDLRKHKKSVNIHESIAQCSPIEVSSDTDNESYFFTTEQMKRGACTDNGGDACAFDTSISSTSSNHDLPPFVDSDGQEDRNSDSFTASFLKGSSFPTTTCCRTKPRISQLHKSHKSPQTLKLSTGIIGIQRSPGSWIYHVQDAIQHVCLFKNFAEKYGKLYPICLPVGHAMWLN